MDSRYGYEVWLLRLEGGASSFYIGNNIINKTIDDPKWINNVRNYAVDLNNIAAKCHEKYLSKHSTLTGKRFKTVENAMNIFLREVA